MESELYTVIESDTVTELVIDNCIKSPNTMKEIRKRKNVEYQRRYRQRQKNKNETSTEKNIRKVNLAQRQQRYRKHIKDNENIYKMFKMKESLRKKEYRHKLKCSRLNAILQQKEGNFSQISENIYNSDNIQDKEREEITATNDVMSVNNTQQSVMQFHGNTPISSFLAPYEQHLECTTPQVLLRQNMDILGDGKITMESVNTLKRMADIDFNKPVEVEVTIINDEEIEFVSNWVTDYKIDNISNNFPIENNTVLTKGNYAHERDPFPREECISFDRNKDTAWTNTSLSKYINQHCELTSNIKPRDMIDSVSSNLIKIIKKLNQWYQQKNYEDCPKNITNSQYTYIKFYYFNLSYNAVTNIILPLSKTENFNESFIERTFEIAKANKIGTHLKQIEELYYEMLEWIKRINLSEFTLKQNNPSFSKSDFTNKQRAMKTEIIMNQDTSNQHFRNSPVHYDAQSKQDENNQSKLISSFNNYNAVDHDQHPFRTNNPQRSQSCNNNETTDPVYIELLNEQQVKAEPLNFQTGDNTCDESGERQNKNVQPTISISFETSTSPGVSLITGGFCKVCLKNTNLKCFNCYGPYYCGTSCQIAMPKIVVRECETLKNNISVRRRGKTSTERSRECRERKRALKNAASQGLNISSFIITKTKPKTPAERSRDYRARKRQKYEENQESNDLTRITVEVEVHQEHENSQPSTSTLLIEKNKTSRERVREFRARKKNH
ncbi:uncharacterized protein LOC114252705 isoform X2 [Bombyx mandarina]|uniref:Uncharacterized protein LOC114252705 isoform X2 n=1 Tax=Bombyx mandarina TaxID=7092 RepID=A0A6J2KL98_BOMMA|nr:uncharacterized protein LOC114252705 isoform X2 [Bombyx mandarina]